MVLSQLKSSLDGLLSSRNVFGSVSGAGSDCTECQRRCGPAIFTESRATKTRAKRISPGSLSNFGFPNLLALARFVYSRNFATEPLSLPPGADYRQVWRGKPRSGNLTTLARPSDGATVPAATGGCRRTSAYGPGKWRTAASLWRTVVIILRHSLQFIHPGGMERGVPNTRRMPDLTELIGSWQSPRESFCGNRRCLPGVMALKMQPVQMYAALANRLLKN
jgi:hypothetical protein